VGLAVQVCSGELEISSVFSRQRLLDVWSDTLGDVQLRRGTMAWTQWHSGIISSLG